MRFYTDLRAEPRHGMRPQPALLARHSWLWYLSCVDAVGHACRPGSGCASGSQRQLPLYAVVAG